MSTEQRQSQGVAIVASAVVGCTLLCALLVAGFLFLVVLPTKPFGAGYQAKHDELLDNLKGIKTAQLQYEANFDIFIPCSKYPSIGPTQNKTPWVKEKSGGFETLGWAPDGDVRGAYMVELINNDSDFIATGLMDLNGDGVYATFVATKSSNPKRISPPDIQ